MKGIRENIERKGRRKLYPKRKKKQKEKEGKY